MTYESEIYHYGVPGMKWGVITKEYVKKGYGNRSSDSGSSLNKSPPASSRSYSVRKTASQPKSTQQDIERQKRRERLKKVAIGAAFVAAAVGISYAAYKGSTKLRDNMRSDVMNNMNTDFNNVHTFSSKYWDSADRKKYEELATKRRDTISSNITRRDAVSQKLYEKTGVRINTFKKRDQVLSERRSEMEFSNFVRDAEKRGALNKSIHDARVDLRKAQESAERYKNTTRIGTSKQYEDFWLGRNQENVDEARKRLEKVLSLRVA